MSIDFESLEELECPLLTQPTNNMCIGELVKLLSYNTMVLERTILNSISPAGLITPYAGDIDTIPARYLLCDGSAYNQSVFPTLFSVIGHSYRTTEPLSNDCFRVPDLRGHNFIGMDLGSGNIGDLGSWVGRTFEDGTPTNGDLVGSQNQYKLTTASGNPIENRRNTLLVPIISTGEVCTA
jgi:microcystin-dependent protein